MSEEKLDRFARGELEPGEARELAQQALDNPELFEDLTYTALAKRAMPAAARRRHLGWPVAALAAAAAVAAAVLGLPLVRARRPAPPQTAAVSGPPIFLARAADGETVFRGTEPESRAPRETGSVTSMDNGAVRIDLGSLDGLAKGVEVDVVREGRTAGRLRLTTIFRERARAEAPPGLAVRAGDRVRVPAAAHLRAVLDEIAARAGRGDAEGARRMAAQTAADGDLQAAAADYWDVNNLGGIAELSGNRRLARSLYERAWRAAPPGGARSAIGTNLARVQGAY